MDNQKVWENITNKIAGEANDIDEAAVGDWLEQEKQNRKTYDCLNHMWSYNSDPELDTSSIYNKFLHRKHQHGKKKTVSPIVYYSLRIAAVCFFLISSAFIANMIIVSNKNEVVIQEISVAKGSRSTFNLPDGTKVWLSNNSTIKYPSRFVGKNRELEITGEAYFEVVHNKRNPFIVNIGDNRIKVLGTHFSVSAYPNDNKVCADLIEGRIQFEIANKTGGFTSYEVKPSHRLTLDKSTGKLFSSKVPNGFYDYWHKGIYEFRNETLEELALRIDRIYNTELIFEDAKLKQKRFSGTISIDDNIFTFIEAVKSTSKDPIEYRYQENKLYLKLK